MDALEILCQRIRGWEERVRDLPVGARLSRPEIRARLARLDLSRAHDLGDLVGEVAELLEDGSLHATHPRFFGLFIASTARAGIVADGLAALYNSQLGTTWHAPAASEIERAVLDYLLGRIGFAPSASASFTTGGAESNLTAVLAALARAFPGAGEAGLAALPRAPVFYGSDQAHDSFVKIAHATGLGRAAYRKVRRNIAHAPGLGRAGSRMVGSAARLRIDLADLRRALAADRAAGRAPFLVVATVGTTATGAIDPLADLAELCRAEELWLHADAAWGGLALLSDRLRPHVAGLELADSISWDAHKTLPVPMGAGMFFCRWRRFAEAPFAVHTAYVPAGSGEPDPYQRTMQWSRRFIGLKVFLTLAELGAAGAAALIDHQAAMADLLRRELALRGWRIVNDSPLPLVCFTRDGAPPALASAIAAAGRVWISDVHMPNGENWLRACITHHQSTADDVRELVSALPSGGSAV
jgi:aromatic-L-amino-acid/L-tryptophan decarboxylase